MSKNTQDNILHLPLAHVDTTAQSVNYASDVKIDTNAANAANFKQVFDGVTQSVVKNTSDHSKMLEDDADPTNEFLHKHFTLSCPITASENTNSVLSKGTLSMSVESTMASALSAALAKTAASITHTQDSALGSSSILSPIANTNPTTDAESVAMEVPAPDKAFLRGSAFTAPSLQFTSASNGSPSLLWKTDSSHSRLNSLPLESQSPNSLNNLGLRDISPLMSFTQESVPQDIMLLPESFMSTPVEIPHGSKLETRSLTTSKSLLLPAVSEENLNLRGRGMHDQSSSYDSRHTLKQSRHFRSLSFGAMDDEDDEDDYRINKMTTPSLPLTPYKNQVGGHAVFLRFSDKALCKPLDPREQAFYELIEANHPDLKPFIASYLGVVNVTFRSRPADTGGDVSENDRFMTNTPVIILEHNKHLLDVYEGVSGDRSPDASGEYMVNGARHYNRKLQQQVLKEALSPKSLRARFAQLKLAACAMRHRDTTTGQHPNESLTSVATTVTFDGENGHTNASDLPVPREPHIFINEPSILKAPRPVSHGPSLFPHSTPKSSAFPSACDELLSDPNHLHDGDTNTPIFHMSDDEDMHCSLPQTRSFSSRPPLAPSNASTESKDRLHDFQSKRFARLSKSVCDDPTSLDFGNESTPPNLSISLKSASHAHTNHSVGSLPTPNDTSASFNPWSLHLYNTKMSKLMPSAPLPANIISTPTKQQELEQQERTHKFLLLEDLTEGMRHPCVLDLKMGTRQHSVHATVEKRISQERKCERSTSKKLGVRICGMQVYKQSTRTYLYLDKYVGRQIHSGNFKQNILLFIDNGDMYLVGLIGKILNELRKLYRVIASMPSYRFYASSLLILYDGDAPVDPSLPRRDADIRMIDFANSVTNADVLRAKPRWSETSILPSSRATQPSTQVEPNPFMPASNAPTQSTSVGSGLKPTIPIVQQKDSATPTRSVILDPSPFSPSFTSLVASDFTVSRSNPKDPLMASLAKSNPSTTPITQHLSQSTTEGIVYVNCPPTTKGPDNGYLLGLETLIANFEEILTELGSDPDMLDANGHVSKQALSKSKRVGVELGLL
ncbi:inositol polyphosphate kinase kcs1 [Batrachochytrium dendrobatidis]|nr:inositol polyphosphate kinase kcs1 [Batrachochytrium dendrobatidis]KAK5671879.1 inositol polyphosphate kinase kcs1 [Batrachochytrium dendrobatidis]